jgi:hypothetical protein
MSIRPQRVRSSGRAALPERQRGRGRPTKAGHLVVIPGGAGKEPPSPKPAGKIEGGRETAPRPKLFRARSEAAPAPSKAARPSLPFALLCSLIVGASILGLVVLNVLVAQSSFKLGDLKARVEEEEARSHKLHYEVSAGESPAHLAEAAHRLGLVIPERQEILVGPHDPALFAKRDSQAGAMTRVRGPEGRERPVGAEPASGQHPGAAALERLQSAARSQGGLTP